MVATQNVVLAVAAGAAAVVQASSNPLSALGLKVRGTNNVFDERGKLPSHGPSLPAALTNIHSR